MNDICNFIPAEESRHNIEFFHFVYETDFEKICKPTRRSNYYAYLIFKGTPTLQIEGIQHELSPGSLFFTRPFQPFSFYLPHKVRKQDTPSISALLPSRNLDQIGQLYDKSRE